MDFTSQIKRLAAIFGFSFLDLRVFNYYKVIKLQEKELINVLCQYGWMDGQHKAVH